MKNIIFKIGIIIVVFFTTSCEKTFNKELKTEVSTANFYKNSNDAEAGLLGCYNKTLQWDVYGKFLFHSDISSDDIQWFIPGGDLEHLEKRNLLLPTQWRNKHFMGRMLQCTGYYKFTAG